MLTGGLLGSVFRGDEFTGPRVIDIVALGLLIFLLLRLVLGRSKKSPQQPFPSDRPGPDTPPDKFPDAPRGAPSETSQEAPSSRPARPLQKTDMYTNAQATWDALRSKPTDTTAPGPSGQPPAAASPDEEFLTGAKMAYSRIRGAVAQRDFDDLASFTTPQYLANLKNSLPLSPPPEPDILLVEATLAERREEASRTVMVVDYNILIHEQDAPHNIDRFERWTFVRDNAAPGANWLLDGMEERRR
jgi:predicted lipid-binding transport protein (Tim44 family)